MCDFELHYIVFFFFLDVVLFLSQCRAIIHLVCFCFNETYYFYMYKKRRFKKPESVTKVNYLNNILV